MMSFLMLAYQNRALNRIPVGMHIKRGHENGDLEFLLMEILVLLGGFYYYHTSVRGSDKEIRIIDLEHANGVAEEIGNEHQQQGSQRQCDSERPMREINVHRHINHKEQQHRADNQAAPFSVYSWSFHMKYSVFSIQCSASYCHWL